MAMDEEKDFDISPMLGIISLIVAVLSGLVCAGRITQQIFATGRAFRLCDSIVYGGRHGLPGKGRRVWCWRQCRYRVIYDAPQISLIPLPSSVATFVPSLIGPAPSLDRLPPEQELLSDFFALEPFPYIGEASWISFYRVLLQACPASVLVNRVRCHADRYPEDLTNVPVPVPLRDLLVLCLFLGMESRSTASADDSINMTGPSGSITSSQHSILGACVRFTLPHSGFGLPCIGSRIDTAWLLRAYGRLRIGNVVLIVGVTPNGETTSGPAPTVKTRCDSALGDLQSPFDDPSHDSPNIQDLEKGLHVQRSPVTTADLKPLHLPTLTFYWLSQVSITPGFWATPFKQTPILSSSVLNGAAQIITEILTDTFDRGDQGKNVVLFDWDIPDLPHIPCGKAFLTYPPYGDRHGHPDEQFWPPMIQLFARDENLVESADFNDCHIPPLFLDTACSPTASFHATPEQAYNASTEIMALDVWLTLTSHTLAIMVGNKRILPLIPAWVDEVLTSHASDFEAMGGRVERPDAYAEHLKSTIDAFGLSRAEMMYLLVALLRTVKVGLCIARGVDSGFLMDEGLSGSSGERVVYLL